MCFDQSVTAVGKMRMSLVSGAQSVLLPLSLLKVPLRSFYVHGEPASVSESTNKRYNLTPLQDMFVYI